MMNALTIDVEDYYQVSGFESIVRKTDWNNFESRLEQCTYRILEILRTADVKATFFILAWNAERHPGLIKDIYDQGHEIACHGYNHRLVYDMTVDEFRADIKRSRKIIEKIIGEDVIGYRAPSYSITEKSIWALSVLAEEGYRYDSSIFPIHHDRYGIPTAPRFPFAVDTKGFPCPKFIPLNCKPYLANQEIIEFPITTCKVLGLNLPISGGGYFRLFPYSISKACLKRINNVERAPFIFYFHPWELDPEQPEVRGVSSISKFRHRINLDKTGTRLTSLLSDFQFTTVRTILGL